MCHSGGEMPAVWGSNLSRETMDRLKEGTGACVELNDVVQIPVVAPRGNRFTYDDVYLLQQKYVIDTDIDIQVDPNLMLHLHSVNWGLCFPATKYAQHNREIADRIKETCEEVLEGSNDPAVASVKCDAIFDAVNATAADTFMPQTFGEFMSDIWEVGKYVVGGAAVAYLFAVFGKCVHEKSCWPWQWQSGGGDGARRAPDPVPSNDSRRSMDLEPEFEFEPELAFEFDAPIVTTAPELNNRPHPIVVRKTQRRTSEPEEVGTVALVALTILAGVMGGVSRHPETAPALWMFWGIDPDSGRKLDDAETFCKRNPGSCT